MKSMGKFRIALGGLAILMLVRIPAIAEPVASGLDTQAKAGSEWVLQVQYSPDAKNQVEYILPYLNAMEKQYEEDGLSVKVSEKEADSTGTGQHDPRGIVRLFRSDGKTAYEASFQDLDLYYLFDAVHRRLEGLPTPNYQSHVLSLLRKTVDNGESLFLNPEGKAVSLRQIAQEETGPLLFIPPGCTPCMLAKYEERTRSLFAEHPRMAIISPNNGFDFASWGWQGNGYLYGEWPGALVLSMRKQSVYGPVIMVAGEGRLKMEGLLAAWRSTHD